MITVNVTRDADVGIEPLWKQLRDFGDLSWFKAAPKVDTIGSGIGTIRRIHMEQGHLDEVLQSLDDASQTLVYNIEQGPAFPFVNYQATVNVSATGSDSATINWSCSFESPVVPEADAVAMLEGAYGMLIGDLITHVKS